MEITFRSRGISLPIELGFQNTLLITYSFFARVLQSSLIDKLQEWNYGEPNAEEKAEDDQITMELSHSLTLNEEALKQLPEHKRPVFVFEWLRFLDKVLVAAQKTDLKGCQKKLVEQLMTHIQSAPGPPTRKLIARCLATLFSVGDTFLLFDTVNKCNDILKNKDDSPSFLPTKL